jgi:lipid-binding SYLF domain-containing protein
MTSTSTKLLAFASMVSLLSFSPDLRAADMPGRIDTATQILDQKQTSDEPIPADLLNHAKGVALFSITKAGLGVGGQGGEGIVLLRLGHSAASTWSAPSAFNLGGGSIGAQIGFTEVRYIVILNTDEAVRHFTSRGKVNWDAMATGTAGSDTGTAKVSITDLERRAIVVYKDSAGIFGGATLGGTSVERQDAINQQAYGDNVRTRSILDGNVQVPQSAARLDAILEDRAS